jgi:beta-phosphoglucomutase family hydrolase
MLKAVIFDMDGVLIDSEPIHMEAHRRLMNRLGLPFDRDYYMQFIGSTTDHMWDKMKKDFEITQTPQELMDMSNEFVKEINGINGYPVMEGASEVIKTLHNAGIKLAVASSSGMERILQSLEKLQVAEEFDCIVSGNEVDKPKPEPDIFLEAAKRLNVSPEECIVIEDSFNGMKAAKNADMICVMYENKSLGTQNSEYADYILQGFTGIDEHFFEMVYAHTKGEP